MHSQCDDWDDYRGDCARWLYEHLAPSEKALFHQNDKFYLSGHISPWAFCKCACFIVRVKLDACRAHFSLELTPAWVFINDYTRAKPRLNTANHRYYDNAPNGDDDRAQTVRWHVDTWIILLGRVKFLRSATNFYRNGQMPTRGLCKCK